MKRLVSGLLVFLLLVGLAACAAAATPAPTSTPLPSPTQPSASDVDSILTLADISDDPAEVADQVLEFSEYLVARLGDYGITKSEVRVAATADEMAQMLKDGEVDIYFDSLYPATLISNASGAEPILRRWRYGAGEYHTIIYTTPESGIKSVEDLPGHMLAMDNAFSTSGYVLPAVYLMDRGLKLTPKKTYEAEVAPDEIGFVFSYDDQNALQWVVSGLADAGVTDDSRFASFPADVTSGLVILAETESVPRQVVLVRPGMDAALKTAIMQILVQMKDTPEGQAALESFDKTAQFDEFPEGIAAAQDKMQKMIEAMQQIILPDWVFER